MFEVSKKFNTSNFLALTSTLGSIIIITHSTLFLHVFIYKSFDIPYIFLIIILIILLILLIILFIILYIYSLNKIINFIFINIRYYLLIFVRFIK